MVSSWTERAGSDFARLMRSCGDFTSAKSVRTIASSCAYSALMVFQCCCACWNCSAVAAGTSCRGVSMTGAGFGSAGATIFARASAEMAFHASSPPFHHSGAASGAVSTGVSGVAASGSGVSSPSTWAFSVSGVSPSSRSRMALMEAKASSSLRLFCSWMTGAGFGVGTLLSAWTVEPPLVIVTSSAI
jgi:hypothetical protein